MRRTVGLIHAVIPAMAPLRAAFAADLPEVRVLHLLDEALLREAERLGGITPGLVRRLATLGALQEAAGAELVLFTATSYSPYAQHVQAQSNVPVLPIDEVMLEKALATGSRLGVLATVAAGLEQQRESIERLANRSGRQVEVQAVLRTDAFAALNAGDGATHDRIMLEELEKLSPRVEVVLLAQASLARLVQQIPPETPVPVLSSPQFAVGKVKETLQL